jgi:hypothetical protein
VDAPRDPATARAAARRAQTELGAALRDNPLVLRDRGPLLEAAARLADDAAR